LIPRTSVREWDLDSVKYFSSLTAHNNLPFSRHSSILNFVPISNHTYIHVLAVWSFGKRSFLTVVVGGNKIPAVWTRTRTRKTKYCSAWIEIDLSGHTESGCGCLAGWTTSYWVTWKMGQSVFGSVVPLPESLTHCQDKFRRTQVWSSPATRKKLEVYRSAVLPFTVVQMLVRKELLLSTSLDSTLRVWIIGTCVPTQEIEASCRNTHISSLVFSVKKLVGLEQDT
jgi:hypothetical protein